MHTEADEDAQIWLHFPKVLMFKNVFVVSDGLMSSISPADTLPETAVTLANEIQTAASWK